MSEILNALKSGEPEDFYISNDDRIALIEALIATAAALKIGKLWFNEPGKATNEPYINLLERMAKKFANMPVEQAQ